MPTVFSAAQLAASAAAGDPRNQDSFATTAEWQAYQAEWFKTVTMGEDLPPVGDPNRSKRWKSTRQQRGKIELQRERQQQPRAQWQRPARNDRQKEDGNEYHKERRQREAQLRSEEDDAMKFLEQIHDASGSLMNANARRLATHACPRCRVERTRAPHRRAGEGLRTAARACGGLATSELEAREKFFAAAHFHGIITARHETPRQLVEELAYTSQEYMDFVHRVGHEGGKVRLPWFSKLSEDEPHVYRLKDKKSSIESKKTSWQALRGSPGARRWSRTHTRTTGSCPATTVGPGLPEAGIHAPGSPAWPTWTARIPDDCGGQRELRATYDVFEGECRSAGDSLWETRRFTMPYSPEIDFPGITLLQARGIQVACGAARFEGRG